MERQRIKEATDCVSSGRSRIAPHAWIVDGKQHIRAFLGEALEELGFVVCQRAHNDDDLEKQPDLVVIALSAGEIEGGKTLNALAAKQFGGMVLLLGPIDSPIVAAVQKLGEELGLKHCPCFRPLSGAKTCVRASPGS